MANVQTSYVKKLATRSIVNGTVEGIKLENVAIQGLTFFIATTGTAEATIAQVIASLKRITVSIGGQDDFNISGNSLYYYNRHMMAGAEVPFQQIGGSEKAFVSLYLPFEMIKGFKPADTLLDLRPRANGSLIQAFVSMETATSANVGSTSEISVYQHYYNYGQYERPVAFRKQMREKQVAVTDGSSAIVTIDYGDDFDDIARMMAFIVNSSGVIQATPFESITLTASEGSTYNLFEFQDTVGYAPIWVPNKLSPRPSSFTGAFDNVFFYDFTKTNGAGGDSHLSGLLDASEMSNLSLNVLPDATGTLIVLLERVNTKIAGDPYAT